MRLIKVETQPNALVGETSAQSSQALQKVASFKKCISEDFLVVLVVKTPSFHCSEVWVPSLLGELRSYVLHSAAKKKKKTQIKGNLLVVQRLGLNPWLGN